MASAMMLRAAAGATALATGPAPRVASPAVVLVSRTARRCVAAQAAKLDKPNRLWELDTVWYPGAEPAPHLDATLAGDRGFDPLGLGANPDTLPWLVEAELYNGRVAMMAVVGILFTEAVGIGPWWTAPFRADYPLPYWPGVVLSHAAMAVFEGKRVANFQKHGETGLLGMAPFDPLGLRDDYKRQSEVRNGRLAMLAFLGFLSQAAITGKAPLQNLADHIADPTRNNIFSSKVGGEVTLAVIAITVLPIIYEARRSLTGEKAEDKNGFRPIPFL